MAVADDVDPSKSPAVSAPALVGDKASLPSMREAATKEGALERPPVKSPLPSYINTTYNGMSKYRNLWACHTVLYGTNICQHM